MICVPCPVSFSQRLSITPQYSGSISTMMHLRFVCSHAISVEPLPPKGSYTTPPTDVLLRMSFLNNPIGFIVGWSELRLGFGAKMTDLSFPRLKSCVPFHPYRMSSC